MLLPLPAKFASLLPPLLKQILRKVRQQVWRIYPPSHLFLFGGRTCYWAGFGQELYAHEPVFRATVQACERHLLALGGDSILADFEQEPDPLFITGERHLQQFVIVIQLALVDLWRSYGVQPNAALGISSGESVAVYAAGGLSLADTLRVSLSAARICEVETASYGTIQLAAGHEQATALCAGCPVGLFLMMESQANRCHLFCALTDMEVAKQYLRAQGAVFQQVKTDPIWPYHTPVVAQHAALLWEPLEAIRPLPFKKPCYLATLGQPLPVGTLLPAEYWLTPPRQPVWQYTTIQAALRDGYQVMTPIGASPFPYLGREGRKHLCNSVRALASFNRGINEQKTFAAMRSELAELGLVQGRKLRSKELLPV